MRTLWAAGLLLLSGCAPALLPSVSTPTPSSGADRREVTVVRVLDGDTFDATDDGSSLRIRILGIDAPEISHDGSTSDCGADAATATLKRLIGDQRVIVEAWYPASVTAPSRDAAYRAAMSRAQTAKAGAWKTCPTLGRQN